MDVYILRSDVSLSVRSEGVLGQVRHCPWSSQVPAAVVLVTDGITPGHINVCHYRPYIIRQ